MRNPDLSFGALKQSLSTGTPSGLEDAIKGCAALAISQGDALLIPDPACAKNALDSQRMQVRASHLLTIR